MKKKYNNVINFEDWEYVKGDYINTKTGEKVLFGDSINKIVDNNIGDALFARCYFEAFEDAPHMAEYESRLFWYLMKMAGYAKSDKYVISFGSESKVKAMKSLNYSRHTIYKAISGLYDKGYVIKLANNMIQINPKYYSRGNAMDVIAIKQSLIKIGETYHQIIEFGKRDKYYDISSLPEQYKKIMENK